MSIYIRPLQEADASVSYRWRNDPEVWKFTGSRPDKTITPEMELNWLQAVLKRENEKRFAICISGTDEYIGNVQLTHIDGYQAEFHIFIGEKKYWGGGFGTAATQLIVDYAFQEMGLECVYLLVKKENTGAVKAYEKAGFTALVELHDGSVKMAAFAMDKSPKTVSVFMITYNHAQYIAQALDSILMQEVDFSYEIVIGEDFSPDNTRDILLEYQKKHPGKIKLLLHPGNIGANRNQIQTSRACTGKYVAMCEGDDYWTDPRKLQKQVDFLAANPDFAMCFHDVDVVYEDPARNYRHSKFFSFDKKDVFTIEDAIKGWFMPTCSLMFRNLVSEWPTLFYTVKSGDIAIAIMLAQYGKIKYLPFTGAAYRKHAGGISVSHNGLNLVRNHLRLFADFENYFQDRYREIFQSARLGLFKDFFDTFAEPSTDLEAGLQLLKTVSPMRAFILGSLLSLNFKAFKVVSWRIL